MTNFLYFKHYSYKPEFNMAFDEWMLSKVINSGIDIILRLYSWSQPAVTFGYNQNELTAFDAGKLGDVSAIRRITGGRALLHDPSELTYSVALSSGYLENQNWGGSVSDSNKEISTVLVSFLELIGIESHYMRKASEGFDARENFHKAPCFESFSRYEIKSNEQKIIASAQRRVKSALLQHGAIKINGTFNHPAVELKSDKYIQSNNLKVVEEDEFIRYSNIFKKSFEERWNVDFEITGLSESDKNNLVGHQNLVAKYPCEKRKIV